jgi:hypothetical protein
MSQLDISDLGAVFVFTGNCSYIHAYNLGNIIHNVKIFLYICVPTFSENFLKHFC